MSKELRQLLMQQQDAMLEQFDGIDRHESSGCNENEGVCIYLIEPVALQNRINGLSRQLIDQDDGNKQILQQLLKPKPLRIAKMADVDALDVLGLQNPHLASICNMLMLHTYQQAITGQPLHFDPVLLISPPGVGKSWFTQQLANVLGLPYFEFQLSGSGDTLQLTGTSSQWGRAAPGELMRRMANCSVANPIIALDEVDKAGGSHWGLIADVLLMLLESENAARFEDKFIGLPARLDLPSYLLTANDVELISGPLRDRCQLQILGLPANQDQRRLLVGRLYSQMLAVNHLTDWFVDHLPSEYCDAFFARDCQSVREIQKLLSQGIGLALQPYFAYRSELAPEKKLLPVVPERQPEIARPRMGFIP